MQEVIDLLRELKAMLYNTDADDSTTDDRIDRAIETLKGQLDKELATE